MLCVSASSSSSLFLHCSNHLFRLLGLDYSNFVFYLCCTLAGIVAVYTTGVPHVGQISARCSKFYKIDSTTIFSTFNNLSLLNK